MFGIFKRSTVVRKSEDKFDKSETKWFKGQKVKIKSGTTSSSSFNNREKQKASRQTWFRENGGSVCLIWRRKKWCFICS